MMKNRRFGKALAMLMAALVMVTTVFASDMTVEAATKKPAITLSATSGTIEVGKTVTVKIKKASNKASKKIKDYKITSSNNKVATVNSSGKITGKKAGTATITLTSNKKVSGKKVTAKYKVTVVKVLSKSISTAKSVNVVQGKTTTLKATVLPANVDKTGVTYATSNKKVATVDKNGKVKGVKAGTTKITITAKDGKAKATVTVKVIKKNSKEAKNLVSKVSFKTTKKTLTVGDTYTQKASVTTKGKNKTVYYQSSNAKVATVDAKTGKVKAVAKGKVTITAYATDGSNKSGKYSITVNPKPAPVVPVTGVTITGAPTSAIKVNAFKPIQLTATVAPANATNKTVTWSAPANSCITVSSTGLVSLNQSFKGAGTVKASVTAKAGEKTATVTISIIYPDPVVPVTGVTITGAPTEAIKANAFESIQLNATVAPANATDKKVTWSVPANSCVTVNSTGLVSLNASFNGVGTTTAEVTATAGGKSAKVTIGVVYSENVDISDDGTSYGVVLDKSAVDYTVSRDGKTRSIATADLATDLSGIAERLNNWNGSVSTLNEKIDAHWGDSEGVILDLINAYSVMIGDAAIQDIKNELDIVYDEENGVYTVTRGDRTITVSRQMNSRVITAPTVAGAILVKYDFTLEEASGGRVVKIANIATGKRDSQNTYVAQADVTVNDTTKVVQMGVMVEDDSVVGAEVLTDNGTTVLTFLNNASTYELTLTRSYYQNMIEKLGVADYMSEIKITQNYK